MNRTENQQKFLLKTSITEDCKFTMNAPCKESDRERERKQEGECERGRKQGGECERGRKQEGERNVGD
jgi:hypothetical protein